jgi:pimeloyl-ACP methyl ester carboxylesterase
VLNFVWLAGWSYTPDIFQPTIQNLDNTLGPQNHIPIDFSHCVDPDSLSSTLIKKLESLPGKTVIIGWSLGAMVIQKVLESKPQIAELIFLISTSPSFVQSPKYPDGIPIKTLNSLRKLVETNTGQTIVSFRSSLYTSDDQNRFLFQKGQESKIPPQQALLAGLDFLAGYTIHPETSSAVVSPIYLMHGELDRICHPNAASKLCDVYRNAKLEILKGIGHDILFLSPPFLSKKIIDAMSELKIL